MLAHIVVAALLVEGSLCQEDSDSVRKLRFRRPRPKLIDIDNPDGDLQGSPVELNVAESAQIASRPGQGNAALEALIATAQRTTTPAPRPQALEIEEVPTRRPLQASEVADTPVRTRTRNRGNVNGVRRRPRPQGGEAGDERRGGPREEPVATLERYSHKNEDGSFTFGYVAADGSFREETRGTDCITRGKYGYIDPEGVKREYSYTSGLACEEGEGNEDDLQNLDGDRVREDTVDPKERFRQTVSEQLTDDQIPNAARPRRPVQRRPQEVSAGQAVQPQPASDSQFANFGAGRQNVPQRRPAPRPRPQAAAPRPAPVPARPQAQGSFDFDAELDGFTLNRPAISFEANQAAANPSSFSSSIAFNQNTGTFQTSLQQNVAGQSLNVQNAAAPQGQTTRAPQTTFQTTASPLTTVQVVTTASPAPVPTEQPRSVPAAAPAVQTIPAGTVKLDFQPLNIPQNLPQAAPQQVVRQPAPAPARPAPAPQAARPAPVPQAARPVPTPQAARPAPQPVPNAPANTFFVFQPFGQNQPQPAPGATPVPTPVNQNAFRLAQPAAVPQAIRVGQPQPVQSRPVPVQSVPRPQQPQQVAVKAAPAPVQARPAPPAPVRQQPAPVRQAAPVQTRPAQPQLQFGFQPVSQTRPGQPLQTRPQVTPFTAFGGGAPRQRPQQLGVPPQLQAGQPQFAQFDSRFRPAQAQPGQQPQLRQPQFQPSAGSVFNPFQALRGA